MDTPLKNGKLLKQSKIKNRDYNKEKKIFIIYFNYT